MSKTNYIKLLVDIFTENRNRWLSITNIIARYYNIKDEDFEKLKKNKNFEAYHNDVCKQFKNYIGHVRAYFDENGGFLLAQKFDDELRYILATSAEEDKKYIANELEKNDTVRIRANERYGIRLDNVKEQGLLPEDKIKKLEESRINE